MQHPLFRPHGAISVNTEDRILIVRAQGPWNAELSQLYGEMVQSQVQALAGAPWAVLGVISREGVHTPDSYSVQVDIIREHHALGRVASAIVFHYFDSPQIARRVFAKMYSEAEEAHEFFEDEESARHWLSEQLRAAG